ncbi:MAG: hypothetical protein AB7N76_30085 [Planctomycetota bacterium]
MSVYRSLSGRRHDLDPLTPEERAFLDEIFAFYRQQPAWEEFHRRWVELGRARVWQEKIAVGSTPYRICQDLTARIGIAEGKVSPPDYRDHLADLIEARFGSRSAFCKQTGVDPGHLSRVLAGKKHLASNTLFDALAALGVQIDLVEPDEVFYRATDPFAPTTPTETLRRLELHLSRLRALLEKATGLAPEDQVALLAEEALAGDELELVRHRVRTGRPLQEAVREQLTSALTEKARLARELAATADAEREAHERVAG